LNEKGTISEQDEKESIQETSSNKELVFIKKGKKHLKRNYNQLLEDVKKAQQDFKICEELSNVAKKEENNPNTNYEKESQNKIILDDEEDDQSKNGYIRHITVEEIDKEMGINASKKESEPEVQKESENKKVDTLTKKSNVFIQPEPYNTNKEGTIKETSSLNINNESGQIINNKLNVDKEPGKDTGLKNKAEGEIKLSVKKKLIFFR
jgi:hypothetical protein